MLTFFREDQHLSVDPHVLTYVFMREISSLFKLLSVVSLQRNWFFKLGSRAINLKTALVTKKGVYPFVAKNFFRLHFLTNRFFFVLWRNRFTKIRRYWRGYIRKNVYFSNFSKNFLKYLFFYRYLT